MDKISVSTRYTVDDIMEVERTFSYVSDLEIVLAILIIQIIVALHMLLLLLRWDMVSDKFSGISTF